MTSQWIAIDLSFIFGYQFIVSIFFGYSDLEIDQGIIKKGLGKNGNYRT